MVGLNLPGEPRPDLGFSAYLISILEKESGESADFREAASSRLLEASLWAREARVDVLPGILTSTVSTLISSASEVDAGLDSFSDFETSSFTSHSFGSYSVVLSSEAVSFILVVSPVGLVSSVLSSSGFVSGSFGVSSAFISSGFDSGSFGESSALSSSVFDSGSLGASSALLSSGFGFGAFEDTLV